MTGLASPGPSLGFDAFGAAVGLSVVSGALAIVEPFLGVLTGTLAALALAAWVLARREGTAGRARFRSRTGWGAWVVLGGMGILYLDPPVPFAPFRSLGLALALVLLWTAERGGRRPAPRERT